MGVGLTTRSWLPLLTLNQIDRAIERLVRPQSLQAEMVRFAIPNVQIKIVTIPAAPGIDRRKHEAALVLTDQRLMDVRMSRLTSRPTKIEGQWPRSTVDVLEFRPGRLVGGSVAFGFRNGTYMYVSFYPGLRWHVESLIRLLAAQTAPLPPKAVG